MGHAFVAVGFLALVMAYKAYRRYTGISLADVPGPESPSFFMGMSIPFLLVHHCLRALNREYEGALPRAGSRS